MKLLAKISRRKSAIYFASSISLAAVAVLDWATGPEVSLSVFYLIPGVLAAWFGARSVGIGFAVASSVAWLLVELNFGRSYQHHLAPYGNGILQLAMALFSALLTAIVRDRERAVREQAAARKKAEMELHLERSLAEAVEAEQQRLGRDIHDGLGQHLVSAGFVASMLKTKLAEKGLPESQEAEELTLLVKDAIGQSRRLARGLFPVKLEAEGLPSALQELADTVSAHSGITCRLDCNCIDFVTDAAMSSNLYRIAQEAVNNAVKHGNAKTITIHLFKSRARVELSIINDGKDYPHDAGKANGMGLRIMEHRTRVISGKIQITAGATGGARVHVTAPLNEQTK